MINWHQCNISSLGGAPFHKNKTRPEELYVHHRLCILEVSLQDGLQSRFQYVMQYLKQTLRLSDMKEEIDF